MKAKLDAMMAKTEAKMSERPTEMDLCGDMNQCMRGKPTGTKVQCMVEGEIIDQHGESEKPEYGDQHRTRIRVSKVSLADDSRKEEAAEQPSRKVPHKTPPPTPYKRA